MRNKYACRAKISESKTRQLVRLFALDRNATEIAEELRLNRNTVNRFLVGIRRSIAEYSARDPKLHYGHDGVMDSCLEEYTRQRLRQFRGITSAHMYLHEQETAFRFYYQGHDLYKVMLKILRNFPIECRSWKHSADRLE